jgi:hypothetical protein
MNNIFFSKTYKEARNKFLEKTNQLQLEIQTYINPNLGIENEELAIDVCFINPNQEKTFLISSGCHGIEGYAGSALQLYILENLKTIEPILKSKNISLILAHGINPWGFSWGRRVTEEGVDLNRNFLDWNSPLPYNRDYDILHEHFVPWIWPYFYADNQLKDFHAKFGPKRMQDVMTLGQYQYPTGLFYGGDKPTWSNLQINKIINSISATNSLLWVDIHTGLGVPGDAEILYAWEDEAIIQKSKEIWPTLNVTEIGAKGSATSKIYGGMQESFTKLFQNKLFVGILYEIGTVEPRETGRALRAEQTIWNNQAQKEIYWKDNIRPYLRSAMYVEKNYWYDSVCKKWKNVFFTALENF